MAKNYASINEVTILGVVISRVETKTTVSLDLGIDVTNQCPDCIATRELFTVVFAGKFATQAAAATAAIGSYVLVSGQFVSDVTGVSNTNSPTHYIAGRCLDLLGKSPLRTFNRVVMVGRTNGQPEQKRTGTGHSVCNFRIVVNVPEQSSDGSWHTHTSWVILTAWGKVAYVASFAQQGQLMGIVGRLRNYSWTDTHSESLKIYVGVNVDTIQLMDQRLNSN